MPASCEPEPVDSNFDSNTRSAPTIAEGAQHFEAKLRANQEAQEAADAVVETACDNGLARASTCAEPGDDIRALIAMFPGTGYIWRFLLESYPGLAVTEVYSTIDRALK